MHLQQIATTTHSNGAIMNLYQWIGFIWFFGMGFGVGYLRGKEVGKVEGYLRHRAIGRHISQLVKR